MIIIIIIIVIITIIIYKVAKLRDSAPLSCHEYTIISAVKLCFCCSLVSGLGLLEGLIKRALSRYILPIDKFTFKLKET